MKDFKIAAEALVQLENILEQVVSEILKRSAKSRKGVFNRNFIHFNKNWPSPQILRAGPKRLGKDLNFLLILVEVTFGPLQRWRTYGAMNVCNFLNVLMFGIPV